MYVMCSLHRRNNPLARPDWMKGACKPHPRPQSPRHEVSSSTGVGFPGAGSSPSRSFRNFFHCISKSPAHFVMLFSFAHLLFRSFSLPFRLLLHAKDSPISHRHSHSLPSNDFWVPQRTGMVSINHLQERGSLYTYNSCGEVHLSLNQTSERKPQVLKGQQQTQSIFLIFSVRTSSDSPH